MRLINTETLALRSFPHDDDRPPYKILSHTWGSEEVTYQEVAEGVHSNKSKGRYVPNIPILEDREGWQKLVRFCYLVHSQGIHWAWIDTCCIDKTSESELSEAINSMYKWYKSSNDCIAYLRDVNISTAFDCSHSQRFTNSRWFKRGWTLQELLAPSSVSFYDQNWLQLGGKHYLSDLIAHATGIAPGFISTPWVATVAQKFSWASTRQTTRAEDSAYCLLGLFNANMPLIYGEGYRGAVARLQLEIIKTSADESIFAWNSGLERSSFNRTSGIFSRDLKYFSGAHDIFLTPYRSWKPYAMTNKGLKITTKLFYPDQVVTRRQEFNKQMDSQVKSCKDLFLMPLNCERRTPGRVLFLYLVIQRSFFIDSTESDFYVRVGRWDEPRATPTGGFDAKEIFLHDGVQTIQPSFPVDEMGYLLSDLKPEKDVYASARAMLPP